MIIDSHTHVFPSFFRDERTSISSIEPGFGALYGSSNARLVGVNQLLRGMDEGLVNKSVIFGFPWEKSEHYKRHNDYVIEAIHRYPDRLIGFCCFSPRSSGGLREAERCLESGLSGVGELGVYDLGLTSEITDALKDITALCSQFRVPLLLHTNEPVGHQYSGKTPMTLSQIYGFLKCNPSNRIILAHWGGGMFFYALMKKEVKEVLKNVWFDVAASPFLYKPDIYRIAGEIIGFEKVLLGSDYPLLEPKRYFREMESVGLAPGSIAQIAGLNAAQLLGLSY
ncbi:MAG: amidohydrolase family protein [Thermodesulfobacteriota bacterium]|nr:amidohydrolase family protein [Thermodesulfobacteriota bacterium]